MTAPDDVRARFEAGVCRYMGSGLASLARCEESGIYLVPAVESMWLGYRAAHADMAGEVRELAEEVIEAINDGDAQSARNAAQAAIDKFQEKP